jgi:putative ABC transport system permease protein
MNLIRLTLKFLLHKPLVTLISILLIILPVTIFTFIIIFDIQAKSYLSRNCGNIDLILGAKGDPKQLATSAILNFGSFTGSISLRDTREIVRNRSVRLAIPIYSLDNFKGFRITGTNKNYADTYKASLWKGTWWQKNMEVVLGYEAAKELKLNLEDTFFSFHGLETGGTIHGDKPFRVVGIMKKSRNSLDNIILCSIESIWLLHADEMSVEARNDRIPVIKDPDDYFPFDFPNAEGKELSAVLIQLRTPILSTSFLPRDFIGHDFQVISPLIETSKIYRSVQFTLGAVGWLGFALSGIALFYLFVRLYYFVDEKSKDLFLVRTLGASWKMTALLVFLQGLFISDIAIFTGIVLSHIALGIAGTFQDVKNLYSISGSGIYLQELIIYFLALCTGALISVIPAWKARHVVLPNLQVEDLR